MTNPELRIAAFTAAGKTVVYGIELDKHKLESLDRLKNDLLDMVQRGQIQDFAIEYNEENIDLVIKPATAVEWVYAQIKQD